jgi:hypothetical protein
MKNLAFREPNPVQLKMVSEQIRSELTEAGISILNLEGPQYKFTEVPYDCFGVLGKARQLEEMNSHSHLWDYGLWDSMQKNNSFSFRFKRNWTYWVVSGYVPLRVADELYSTDLGKRYVRSGGDAGLRLPLTWSTWVGGKRFVDCYHIDTQEGLNLFVSTVQRHLLVEGLEPPSHPINYADWPEFAKFMKDRYDEVVFTYGDTSIQGGFHEPHQHMMWQAWRHARDTA